MEGAMKDNAPHGGRLVEEETDLPPAFQTVKGLRSDHSILIFSPDEAIMIDDTGVTAPLQSHVHHVIDANRQRKRSQQMADDEMADGQSRFDSDSETEFEKKNVVDFITGRNQKYTFNPNESILDQKVQMVVHYMRQQIGKSGIHKKAMDQEEIQKYVEEVLRVSHQS